MGSVAALARVGLSERRQERRVWVGFVAGQELCGWDVGMRFDIKFGLSLAFGHKDVATAEETKYINPPSGYYLLNLE